MSDVTHVNSRMYMRLWSYLRIFHLCKHEFGRRFVPKRLAFKGSSTLLPLVLLQLAVRRIWSRDGTTWRPSIANHFWGLGFLGAYFGYLLDEDELGCGLC